MKDENGYISLEYALNLHVIKDLQVTIEELDIGEPDKVILSAHPIHSFFLLSFISQKSSRYFNSLAPT